MADRSVSLSGFEDSIAELQVKSFAPAQTKPITAKLCTKCGKQKELTAFYMNREYRQQFYKDGWCKECVSTCTTRAAIREYFWVNNRKWNQKIWDAAVKKAEKAAQANKTVQKMNEQRKAAVMEKLTCQCLPTCMAPYYEYEDHRGIPYVADKEEEANDTSKIWDDDWNGSFTRRQLKYLNTYFNNLIKGKDPDVTQIDYMRKISKQSLICDQLEEEHRNHRCEHGVYKDALSIYDMLNKSANLANCKKKEEASTNELSISEITKYLQEHGRLMTRKLDWDRDEVDKTIDEFRYTVTQAIGVDD